MDMSPELLHMKHAQNASSPPSLVGMVLQIGNNHAGIEDEDVTSVGNLSDGEDDHVRVMYGGYHAAGTAASRHHHHDDDLDTQDSQSADLRTAELIQEEEMMKLALERSLQDVSSFASPIKPAQTRNNKHDPLMGSPTERMSYSVSPSVKSARRSSFKQHQQAGDDHSSFAGRRSTSSPSKSQRIQTDRRTGLQYIWKKAPNNRYVKVPVNELGRSSRHHHHSPMLARRPPPPPDELGGGHSSHSVASHSCASYASSRGDRLLDQVSCQSSVADMTEEEQLELALERSLKDASKGSGHHHQGGGGGGYFRYTNSTTSSSVQSSVGGGRTRPSIKLSSSSPERKAIVWKKDPNNKYRKHHIGLLGEEISDDLSNDLLFEQLHRGK